MRMPLFILGGPLLWLVMPAPAQAQSVPDYFEITDITVNGAGCIPGSVSKNVAADKLSFTLGFQNYVAEVGPYLNPSDARKSCQMNISLKIPAGWRFAIASFDYRGYMNLDAGISAEHKTSYYFQAFEKTGEFSSTKVGPEQKDFRFQQQVDLNEVHWSACDNKRSLNIKTAIRLWNSDRTKYPNASGVMGTDAIDGQFQDQNWKLAWGRCP